MISRAERYMFYSILAKRIYGDLCWAGTAANNMHEIVLRFAELLVKL